MIRFLLHMTKHFSLRILLSFLLISSNCWSQAMTSQAITESFKKGQSASIFSEAAQAKIDLENNKYRSVIVSGGEPVASATRELDRLSLLERKRLPLGGVPILVKDNIEVSGWATTAGSTVLADNLTNRDADLVKNLKQAGAIILGKTNLSEWANFRSRKSLSGWSGVGGQTRNAHDPLRSPCGSSSGSAVAVARGYVPVAIGSETDGSIVCPAAVNGVVGFKPTHGLVSGEGVIPLAPSQDTAGPIAVGVRDAALALGVMIKEGKNELIRSELMELSELSSLNGISIGVLSNTTGVDKQRDNLLENAVELLVDKGANVVREKYLEPYEGLSQDEFAVLLYEFRGSLNQYLASLPNKLNQLSLRELDNFNKNSDLELSLFDQSIFEMALSQELSVDEYQGILQRIKRASRQDGIDRFLDVDQLDVMIGITMGPAWVIDESTGDVFEGPSMSQYPAIGGHPHITLPMGSIDGLPIGISFIGRRMGDAGLASIALVFEEARKKVTGRF